MENEKTKKITTAIISVIILVPAAILSGWVITKLWVWFICPFGIKSISIAQAIGIDLLITLIISTHRQDKKYEIEEIISIAIKPLWFLLFGFIVHLFL